MLDVVLVGDGGKPEIFTLCGSVVDLVIDDQSGSYELNCVVKPVHHEVKLSDPVTMRFVGSGCNFEVTGSVTARKALRNGQVRFWMRCSSCSSLEPQMAREWADNFRDWEEWLPA